MPRGYGNWGDPKLPERDDSIDQPHPKRSLTQKIMATLPPGKRDTSANRRMAKSNGWTDEEFEAWVNGESDDSGIREG